MASPYRATKIGNIVIRNADGANVPMDLQNLDYQAYRAWVAAGGVPDNADLGNVVDTVFSNNLVNGLFH
jgi:hypothetical protein